MIVSQKNIAMIIITNLSYQFKRPFLGVEHLEIEETKDSYVSSIAASMLEKSIRNVITGE